MYIHLPTLVGAVIALSIVGFILYKTCEALIDTYEDATSKNCSVISITLQVLLMGIGIFLNLALFYFGFKMFVGMQNDNRNKVKRSNLLGCRDHTVALLGDVKVKIWVLQDVNV